MTVFDYLSEIAAHYSLFAFLLDIFCTGSTCLSTVTAVCVCFLVAKGSRLCLVCKKIVEKKGSDGRSPPAAATPMHRQDWAHFSRQFQPNKVKKNISRLCLVC